MDFDTVIEKHALANAVKYKGKANPQAVLGGVIKDVPDAKNDLNTTNQRIQDIVDHVNTLSEQEQQVLIEKKFPELLEKKEQPSRELKELENVDPGKQVVMRFAPSPSGPMHIGHAMTGGLTSLYIDKYNGKFILRIEDTNPANIYPPAYDLLVEDADWIFGNVSEVWIQSERLETYYSYAKQFLDQGDAYVCTCDSIEFKKLISQKKACPCRALDPEEQVKRWSNMFDKEHGYQQGEAVLRFKSDINHDNPAMRDFPLARINDEEHQRQGFAFRVWPLMNLSVFVDDVEAGMTHVIRAKDHADNAKRQALMYRAIGKTEPTSYFVGRINFEGLELSASKTREKIDAGRYTGWDDIRLPFLGALKRRGYQPEAFKNYAKSIGLSLTDKTVHAQEFFKALNAYNKDIIDAKTDRYFFIARPEPVTVKGVPETGITLHLHPDYPERGDRHFTINEAFFLDHADFEVCKEGELVRLMDGLNVRKKGKTFVFDSFEYDQYKKEGKHIMHWLPRNETVEAEVRMPDNTVVKGLAEKNVLQIEEGTVVQFERFGFCRLDKREGDKLFFWYGHR